MGEVELHLLRKSCHVSRACRFIACLCNALWLELGVCLVKRNVASETAAKKLGVSKR